MDYQLVVMTPLGRFQSVRLSKTEAEDIRAIVRRASSYLSFNTPQGQLILRERLISQSAFRIEEVLNEAVADASATAVTPPKLDTQSSET